MSNVTLGKHLVAATFCSLAAHTVLRGAGLRWSMHADNGWAWTAITEER